MRCPQVGVGASGAIYAIMGGWLSHVICTWHEEDEFAKGAQLTQVSLIISGVARG